MASKCHEGDGVIPAPRMWPREPHGLPRAAPAPHSPLASARASAVAPVALSATVTCTRDCVSLLPGPAPRRARAEKPPPSGGGSRPSTRMGFWGTVLRGGLGRACPQLRGEARTRHGPGGCGPDSRTARPWRWAGVQSHREGSGSMPALVSLTVLSPDM